MTGKTRLMPFIICALAGIVIISCTKQKNDQQPKQKVVCNCTQAYDANVIYHPTDMVGYDGKCWYAVAQGRGVTPGPWLQNYNDVWKECIGYQEN